MNITKFKKVMTVLRVLDKPTGTYGGIPPEKIIDFQGDSEARQIALTVDDDSTQVVATLSNVETSDMLACVNFKKFNSFVGAVKTAPAFDIIGKDLSLRFDRRDVTLSDASMFRFDLKKNFTANGDARKIADVSQFLKALKYCLVATSNDVTRFHLNGALFTHDGHMVATDGHRLHMAELEFGLEDKDVIISQKMMKIMIAAIAACGPTARVVYFAEQNDRGDYSQLQFVVIGGELEFWITGALIDCKFPNYTAVIPKEHTTRLSISTKQLGAAAKLVQKISDCPNKSVSLQIIKDTLALVSQGVSETMPVIVEELAEDQEKIGVDSKYLLEAVGMPEERITISVSGALDPVVLTQEGFLAVVMPVRI